MEKKRKIDHIDTTLIDLGLDINTNIINIKSVSLWWCLHVLSQHLNNI